METTSIMTLARIDPTAFDNFDRLDFHHHLHESLSFSAPSEALIGTNLVSTSQSNLSYQNYGPPQPVDWELIRPRFTDLYINQDMKLSRVMQIIADEFGLLGTVSAYKKRIDTWGLSKSWTSDEKIKWGTMAQILIATHQPLPEYDEFDRLIPWDRVRRHCGVKRIPLQYLPARFHTQRQRSPASHDSVSLPEYTVVVTENSCENAELQRPGSKRQRPTPLHCRPLHSISLEESVLFHIPEWISWCSASDRPIYFHLVWLNGKRTSRRSCAPQHCVQELERRIQYYMKHSMQKQATHVQSLLAKRLHALFRQPAIHLLATILHLWWTRSISCPFKDYNIALMKYITHECEESLGEHNPITTICRNLRKLFNTGTRCFDERQTQARMLVFVENFLTNLGQLSNRGFSGMGSFTHNSVLDIFVEKTKRLAWGGAVQALDPSVIDDKFVR